MSELSDTSDSEEEEEERTEARSGREARAHIGAERADEGEGAAPEHFDAAHEAEAAGPEATGVEAAEAVAPDVERGGADPVSAAPESGAGPSGAAGIAPEVDSDDGGDINTPALFRIIQQCYLKLAELLKSQPDYLDEVASLLRAKVNHAIKAAKELNEKLKQTKAGSPFRHRFPRSGYERLVDVCCDIQLLKARIAQEDHPDGDGVVIKRFRTYDTRLKQFLLSLIFHGVHPLKLLAPGALTSKYTESTVKQYTNLLTSCGLRPSSLQDAVKKFNCAARMLFAYRNSGVRELMSQLSDANREYSLPGRSAIRQAWQDLEEPLRKRLAKELPLKWLAGTLWACTADQQRDAESFSEVSKVELATSKRKHLAQGPDTVRSFKAENKWVPFPDFERAMVTGLEHVERFQAQDNSPAGLTASGYQNFSMLVLTLCLIELMGQRPQLLVLLSYKNTKAAEDGLFSIDSRQLVEKAESRAMLTEIRLGKQGSKAIHALLNSRFRAENIVGPAVQRLSHRKARKFVANLPFFLRHVAQPATGGRAAEVGQAPDGTLDPFHRGDHSDALKLGDGQAALHALHQQQPRAAPHQHRGRDRNSNRDNRSNNGDKPTLVTPGTEEWVSVGTRHVALAVQKVWTSLIGPERSKNCIVLPSTMRKLFPTHLYRRWQSGEYRPDIADLPTFLEILAAQGNHTVKVLQDTYLLCSTSEKDPRRRGLFSMPESDEEESSSSEDDSNEAVSKALAMALDTLKPTLLKRRRVSSPSATSTNGTAAAVKKTRPDREARAYLLSASAMAARAAAASSSGKGQFSTSPPSWISSSSAAAAAARRASYSSSSSAAAAAAPRASSAGAKEKKPKKKPKKKLSAARKAADVLMADSEEEEGDDRDDIPEDEVADFERHVFGAAKAASAFAASAEPEAAFPFSSKPKRKSLVSSE